MRWVKGIYRNKFTLPANSEGNWLLSLPFSEGQNHNFTVKVSEIEPQSRVEPETMANIPAITNSGIYATELTANESDWWLLTLIDAKRVSVKSIDNCDFSVGFEFYEASDTSYVSYSEDINDAEVYNLAAGEYLFKVTEGSGVDCIAAFDINIANENKWKVLTTSDANVNIATIGVSEILSNSEVLYTTSFSTATMPIGYTLNSGNLIPLPQKAPSYGILEQLSGLLPINKDLSVLQFIAPTQQKKSFKIKWIGATGNVYQFENSKYVERKSGDQFIVDQDLLLAIPNGYEIDVINAGENTCYGSLKGMDCELELVDAGDTISITLQQATLLNTIEVADIPANAILHKFDGQKWVLINPIDGIPVYTTDDQIIRVSYVGVPKDITVSGIDIDDQDVYMDPQYLGDGWHIELQYNTKSLIIEEQAFGYEPNLITISGPGSYIIQNETHVHLDIRNSSFYWFNNAETRTLAVPDVNSYLETGDTHMLISGSNLVEGENYTVSFASVIGSIWETNYSVPVVSPKTPYAPKYLNMHGKNIEITVPVLGNWNLEVVKVNGSKSVVWSGFANKGVQQITLPEALPVGAKVRLIRN